MSTETKRFFLLTLYLNHSLYLKKLLKPNVFFNTQDRAENQFKFSKEDASVLLMVVGIANTVGRIVLGYISDRGWIKRLYLYNICLAICGIGECIF